MRWVLGLIGLIVVGVAASWWWATKDYKPMDEAARADAAGQFADIPGGKIHYRWLGPVDGGVIVMVHGFSSPNRVFEANAQALAADGHRVLMFDHFGRGLSDRPKGAYDADFYDAELVGLLDTLGVTGPVGLVGLSMGGVITPEFAARHPERVNRVALLVPAGLDTNGADGAMRTALDVPVVGDWLWAMTAPKSLFGDMTYQETDNQAFNQLQKDILHQVKFKGYFPALLSSLRHLQMKDNEAVFTGLAETGLPVLAIYGTADDVVEISSADRLATLMPNADIQRIEGGDHAVNIFKADEVNALLLDFFRSDT